MTPTEKCLAAYNHVLKILEINNDNYFKRTQILMIVAQSALFVGFVRILTVKKDTLVQSALITKPIALIALLVITLLGALSALVWVHFIRRQCNILNLCKSYLRGIECNLMELGVPLGYWTYESMMAHPESYKKPLLVMHFTIDSGLFPFPMTDSGKFLQDKYCERFPREKDKEFKIGLTKIEQSVAWGLFVLWMALAVPVVLSLCASNNGNKQLIAMIVPSTLWLSFVILTLFWNTTGTRPDWMGIRGQETGDAQ